MNKTNFPIYLIFLSSLLLALACNNPATTPNPSSNTLATPNQDSTPQPPVSTSSLQEELDLLERQQGNLNRTIWQQPRMIIQRLGDLSDKTVVDIGAGPFGYFSFQLVGEAKKVIATDIDPKALAFMDSLKTDILPPRKQKALEVRLAFPDNPNLQPQEADVIILMNIYAYLSNTANYLTTLQKGLKPDGKLLIVDFKMRHLPLGPSQAEKVPLFKIEQDLNKAGFQIQLTDDCSLDYQYMIIAGR